MKTYPGEQKATHRHSCVATDSPTEEKTKVAGRVNTRSTTALAAMATTKASSSTGAIVKLFAV